MAWKMLTLHSPVITTANGPAHKAPLGLRGVAIFELIKGVLFLAIGLGALSLVGKDVEVEAEKIILRLHLDPAWHYCDLFIRESAKVTDTRLLLIALVTLTLSAIRLVESYGLWHERAWAEWLAVISAGIYMPFEVYHLYHNHFSHKPVLVGAVVFLVNAAIVVYLSLLLAANHRRKVAERAAPKN